MADPGSLLEGFVPTEQQYAIAARVHGRLAVGLPGRPARGRGRAGASGSVLKESKGEADLVIVADTDILSDMLWIRRQSLFGQPFAVAWANNGDLLANALDNLAGSEDLISVRGRQSFFRPFTRVDELRQRADERLREKEQELDRELKDTEQKLTALESARGDAGAGLVLTPQQQAELERFQAERLRIRRELREVRRGLDVEIDRLGTMLKVINIALVPALLADRGDPARMAAPPAARGRTSRRSGRCDSGRDARMTQRGRWTLALAHRRADRRGDLRIDRSTHPIDPPASASCCTRRSRRRSTRSRRFGSKVPASTTAVTLERAEETAGRSAERAGYPADASRVRDACCSASRRRARSREDYAPGELSLARCRGPVHAWRHRNRRRARGARRTAYR